MQYTSTVRCTLSRCSLDDGALMDCFQLVVRDNSLCTLITALNPGTIKALHNLVTKLLYTNPTPLTSLNF